MSKVSIVHVMVLHSQEAIEKSVLKLIDFGLAREFAPDQARWVMSDFTTMTKI